MTTHTEWVVSVRNGEDWNFDASFYTEDDARDHAAELGLAPEDVSVDRMQVRQEEG